MNFVYFFCYFSYFVRMCDVFLILHFFQSNEMALVYQFVPKMNLVDLFCNLAGLAGIWVGWSILSILDEIGQFISQISLQHLFKNCKRKNRVENVCAI